MAQLGDRETAGADLQRAYTLAEQVRSPTLLYPIATELGQWYETVGREQEARACYTKAKATIEQIINALEDQNLRAIFLQSALVQAVTTHVLSGTDKEGDRSHGQHKAEPDCVSIASTARRIGRDSSRSENRG